MHTSKVEDLSQIQNRLAKLNETHVGSSRDFFVAIKMKIASDKYIEDAIRD